MAQVRKNKYKGMQGKDLGGPKSSQNPRPQLAESKSDSKLTKLILDMKAEFGVLHNAMINHGISVESTPPHTKQKKHSAVVKQNGKYAGIAKKRNRNRRPGSEV